MSDSEESRQGGRQDFAANNHIASQDLNVPCLSKGAPNTDSEGLIGKSPCFGAAINTINTVEDIDQQSASSCLVTPYEMQDGKQDLGLDESTSFLCTRIAPGSSVQQ